MAADIPEKSTVNGIDVPACVRAAILAALPGIAVDGDLDMDADLVSAELDSLAALAIMTAIEDDLGLVGRLDVTAPFRYPTPAGVVGYLQDELRRG